MRDSQLFDVAVLRFFEPIAKAVGLPLSKIEDGVYEIPSPHFILRIRLHTGHHRGINVILRRTSAQTFDEKNPGYGIGHFVSFEGGEWNNDDLVETDADFTRQVDQFAKASAEFVIPYLLGKGEHFEAIEQQVAERNKIGGAKEMKGSF